MKKLITISALFCMLYTWAQQSVLYRDANQKAWVDSIYSQLTLQEKIGQLFIVAAYSNKTQAHENEILQLIKEEHIGGLIFMQNNADKQIQLTNWYQQNATIPLLIGTDAEWGLAMRLDNIQKFPYAMTLGAIQNDDLIFQMGEKIAEHCSLLGIHWNFSPDVDVNTNPKNPIIGNRSFGSDVDNVSRKGIAYANGMKSHYILASAKHFPGHGDTSTDSHSTLPVIKHPLSRLQNIELQPFQNLIDDGVTGIMVAHLDVPSLEPNGLPSTLSKSIITDLLQNQMQFQGLIITDALNMQGVASQYAAGIVDVKAFEAGNDILLFSQNVRKATEKIEKKILTQEISMERLEYSVKKILMAKYFVGLHQYQPLATESVLAQINDESSTQLIQTLYENAITLVKNQSTLPYVYGEKVNFIPMGSDYASFAQKLSEFTNVHTLSDGNALFHEKVVIGVFKDTSSPYKSYKISASEQKTIQSIAQNNEVTLVLFTSPYSLIDMNIDSIKNVIVAYENNDFTQSIVPQMLYGEKSIIGRIPADINASLPYGSGVDIWAQTGMPKATPESQGMRREVLQKIDEYAHRSIANHEAPGMQVLVAKNGKIVFEKNYGHYTYNQFQAVTDSTLYDLASVTKVMATLPLFMQLYDQKKIRLDDPIGMYFPYAENTDKAPITFREILLHNSGLKSWIPFYKETLDNENHRSQNYYSHVVSEQFRYAVTENIYSRFTVKDLVYQSIAHSTLEPKTYDYSDLGFYILQYAIEHFYHQAEDIVFSEKIAQPMGLKRLLYRPLTRYSAFQIAPSEVDGYYRDQVIQGTVQDQGAALFGGVAGHAGLFGNAKDVASLMQMYLDGGVYNGSTIIDGGTIGYFSSFQNSSRRGLGFDKQKGTEGPFFDHAPSSGFGHTGYTGTMVWADPVQQLVFVFLSNRTYPDASSNKLNRNKTRQHMLELVYKSLM